MLKTTKIEATGWVTGADIHRAESLAQMEAYSEFRHWDRTGQWRSRPYVWWWAEHVGEDKWGPALLSVRVEEVD